MSWEGRVGWCPSVVTPMEAHDGLLVRVKPTAATLPADALRAIADAASTYGNGQIDLTNRGNLQVRGLSRETAETFADIVRSNGLASDNAALEEVRNVAADPLGSDDPAAIFDSHAIAHGIETMLSRSEALCALPPKFGFLVDCSPTMPIPDRHADIVVRAHGETLTIGLGGGTGRIACTSEEAPALAHRLAIVFLELAGPSDEPPYRMRDLVDTTSETAILAEAGLTARPAFSAPSESNSRSHQCVSRHDNSGTVGCNPVRAAQIDLMYAPAPTDSPIGFVSFAGRNTGAVVTGAVSGRIGATALAELASLSARYADATVRMTPWRALAFAPINGDNAGSLLSALSDLGLITDPTDPRRTMRRSVIAPAEGEAITPETLPR